MRIAKLIVLVGIFTMAGSAFAQCRDPWVTEVVNNYTKRMKGRALIGSGDVAECNYKLYGSNWNSKAQLEQQVAQTFQSLKEAGLEWKYEKVMSDLRYFTSVHAYDQNIYVGPKTGSPYADQAQTAGGTYWWHVPLPNNHVLVVARKCRRGYSSAGPGANSGCVR